MTTVAAQDLSASQSAVHDSGGDADNLTWIIIVALLGIFFCVGIAFARHKRRRDSIHIESASFQATPSDQNEYGVLAGTSTVLNPSASAVALHPTDGALESGVGLLAVQDACKTVQIDIEALPAGKMVDEGMEEGNVMLAKHEGEIIAHANRPESHEAYSQDATYDFAVQETPYEYATREAQSYNSDAEEIARASRSAVETALLEIQMYTEARPIPEDQRISSTGAEAQLVQKYEAISSHNFVAQEVQSHNIYEIASQSHSACTAKPLPPAEIHNAIREAMLRGKEEKREKGAPPTASVNVDLDVGHDIEQCHAEVACELSEIQQLKLGHAASGVNAQAHPALALEAVHPVDIQTALRMTTLQEKEKKRKKGAPPAPTDDTDVDIGPQLAPRVYSMVSEDFTDQTENRDRVTQINNDKGASANQVQTGAVRNSGLFAASRGFNVDMEYHHTILECENDV